MEKEHVEDFDEQGNEMIEWQEKDQHKRLVFVAMAEVNKDEVRGMRICQGEAAILTKALYFMIKSSNDPMTLFNSIFAALIKFRNEQSKDCC